MLNTALTLEKILMRLPRLCRTCGKRTVHCKVRSTDDYTQPFAISAGAVGWQCETCNSVEMTPNVDKEYWEAKHGRNVHRT